MTPKTNRALREGWQTTFLENHLWYKGKLVLLIEEGPNNYKLITDCKGSLLTVVGESLDEVCKKIEQEID